MGHQRGPRGAVPEGMALPRRRWGPESIGMLSMRENYKLSKNMEIQEKSGLEKKV